MKAFSTLFSHKQTPNKALGSDIISPPLDAQLSDQSTNFHLSRNGRSHSPHGLSKTSSKDDGQEGDLPILPSGQPVAERVNLRLATIFFTYFLCGWGDGITGTVLPYFVEEFHLTHMSSSLLFTGSTVGFAIGTVVVERSMNLLGRIRFRRHLHRNPPSVEMGETTGRSQPQPLRFSALRARHRTLILGSIIHSFHFIMMGSRVGFGMMFAAYAVAAFARAYMTAPLNAYCSSGPKQALGYAFGMWSLGGVASPLVCQAIIAKGVPWFHFYYGSLVVSFANFLFLSLAFQGTPREFARESAEAEFTTRRSDSIASVEKKEAMSPAEISVVPIAHKNTSLHRALKMPYQWAFSIFAWMYCGSETTTQGFMVTYLLATRNANPLTVGYVTSGFWGGITVGRFVWGYYTPRFTFTQRKYIVQASLALALVMQLLIWFVNSNVENAFSASVIGVLYGPIFPACLEMATALLPEDVHLISMALISTLASFGSALFPFIAGAIASVKGVKTLTYILVPQVAVLLCMWTVFPSRPKQTTAHGQVSV